MSNQSIIYHAFTKRRKIDQMKADVEVEKTKQKRVTTNLLLNSHNYEAIHQCTSPFNNDD